MHRSQMMGYIIREIRQMAFDGSSIARIMEYLEACTPGSNYTRYEYLREAFPSSWNYFFTFSERPISPETEVAGRKLIFERRDEWAAHPVPELMRLEDYFAFSRFALEEKVLVLVRGATRHAGAYVGRAGFQCYDSPLFVVSREEAPHLGLIAADPSDLRLQAALRAFPEPLGYDDYCQQLGRLGLRRLGPEDGYVLETASGARLYEPYRLHGVYEEKGGHSAWRGDRGERLRGVLNRHLGDELVRFGPHDDWQHRNDASIAGPLAGPLFPVVAFYSNGRIDNQMIPDDLISSWHYGDQWARRYPGLPDKRPDPEE